MIALLRESEASWLLTDFVIKSVGLTAARNLRVAIDPPYLRAEEEAGYEFMNVRFITGPTSVLPPGEELRTYFEMAETFATPSLPAVSPSP